MPVNQSRLLNSDDYWFLNRHLNYKHSIIAERNFLAMRDITYEIPAEEVRRVVRAIAFAKLLRYEIIAMNPWHHLLCLPHFIPNHKSGHDDVRQCLAGLF